MAPLSAGPLQGLRSYFSPKAPQGPLVRVYLGADHQKVSLQVLSGCRILDPKTKKAITSVMGGRTADLAPAGDGLTWGEGFPGYYQLTVVPDGPFLLLDKRPFFGNVSAYMTPTKLHLVVEAKVEDWVAMVLASSAWEAEEEEAMHAAVMVLRTYFQSAIGHGKQFWDIQSQWLSHIFPPSEHAIAKIKQLMRKTKGLQFEPAPLFLQEQVVTRAQLEQVWGAAVHLSDSEDGHVTITQGEKQFSLRSEEMLRHLNIFAHGPVTVRQVRSDQWSCIAQERSFIFDFDQAKNLARQGYKGLEIIKKLWGIEQLALVVAHAK